MNKLHIQLALKVIAGHPLNSEEQETIVQMSNVFSGHGPDESTFDANIRIGNETRLWAIQYITNCLMENLEDES